MGRLCGSLSCECLRVNDIHVRRVVFAILTCLDPNLCHLYSSAFSLYRTSEFAISYCTTRRNAAVVLTGWKPLRRPSLSMQRRRPSRR